MLGADRAEGTSVQNGGGGGCGRDDGCCSLAAAAAAAAAVDADADDAADDLVSYSCDPGGVGSDDCSDSNVSSRVQSCVVLPRLNRRGRCLRSDYVGGEGGNDDRGVA
jgi:hypothetical protein